MPLLVTIITFKSYSRFCRGQTRRNKGCIFYLAATMTLLQEDIPHIWTQLFEPDLLSEMREIGELRSAEADNEIIRVGDTVRIMPILLEGVMKVSRVDESGKELLLYYVNANESCAMTFTCCMQAFPSQVNVVAEEDTKLIALPISKMDEWMSKYPTWKAFVMTTIRKRFEDMLVAIDQVIFQKLDERLMNYLKEKSNAVGSTLLNISHEQIAVDMASSREVISRLLKRLENDNKLLLYRKQIKLLKDF